MIRVELPHHLRVLAQLSGEVTVEVTEPVTLRRVLDALEARFCVSSRARRICRTTRRTNRCRKRWRPGRSRCW